VCGRPVSSKAAMTILITNTYNRIKLTTPISEEEVSVSAILFFKKAGGP